MVPAPVALPETDQPTSPIPQEEDRAIGISPVAETPAVLEPAPDSEIIRVEPEHLEPASIRARFADTALPRNAPEIPRVTLELPPESGLVLVETSHAAEPATEETEPERPRRVRPPRIQIADEPLQMVETTHKDSTPPAS